MSNPTPSPTALKAVAKDLVRRAKETDGDRRLQKTDVVAALVEGMNLERVAERFLEQAQPVTGTISQAQALNALARTYGYRTWNALAASDARPEKEPDGSGSSRGDAEKGDTAVVTETPDAHAPAPDPDTPGGRKAALESLKYGDARAVADALKAFVPEQSTKMWESRAHSLCAACASAFADLRDNGGIDLDFQAVIGLIDARNLFALAGADARGTISYTREEENEVKRVSLNSEQIAQALSPVAQNRVKIFVASLPGWNPDKGMRQSQATIDQHGYITMQLLSPLMTAHAEVSDGATVA